MTCGVTQGCITAVVDDVQCPDCIAALRAQTQALYSAPPQPEDPYSEAFDVFENLRPGQVEELRRQAARATRPTDQAGGA